MNIHLCCLEPADGPHAGWCTEQMRTDAGQDTRQQRRQRERQQAKAAGPDLHAVHEIDQSHASAYARLDGLLAYIRAWVAEHGGDETAADVLENPMIFIAIVKILETRVDITELPYMLSAAILRVASIELRGE